MKISNSKKQLAEIIHENGGWRDGAESAAQCIGGEISFWHDTATKRPGEDWCGSYLGACGDIEFTGVKLRNWHQTILSRDEYFHLYPAPDADGWIEWRGGECPLAEGTPISIRHRDGEEFTAAFALSGCNVRWRHEGTEGDVVAYRLRTPEVQVEVENKTTCHMTVTDKPTIEQLAADYRNRKDYADRKQQEADAAKEDADAKLAALVAAGKALGLVWSVADAVRVEPEPELVITDWLDLQVGDEVEASYRGEERLVGSVLKIDFCDSNQPIFVSDGSRSIWATEFRFIRRPAKGAADA